MLLELKWPMRFRNDRSLFHRKRTLSLGPLNRRGKTAQFNPLEHSIFDFGTFHLRKPFKFKINDRPVLASLIDPGKRTSAQELRHKSLTSVHVIISHGAEVHSFVSKLLPCQSYPCWTSLAPIDFKSFSLNGSGLELEPILTVHFDSIPSTLNLIPYGWIIKALKNADLKF